MYKSLLAVLIVTMSSCSTTYYVVRHAEKEPATTMSSDVALTSQGKARAEALKNTLSGNKIKRIYSTNYIRTKSTVQPFSDLSGITIQTYDPRDTTFPKMIRQLNENVLIVGHSNTVDDLVNGITGQRLLQDLPETQYGDLFVIKKKGQQFRLETRKF